MPEQQWSQGERALWSSATEEWQMMPSMIWFCSAVIAKEHESLLTLWPHQLHNAVFKILSLRASICIFIPHPWSFLPPLFPCSYFMFYCRSYKLSHNFLTVLFKGRLPPFLCFFPLPRPLSSSPFREAPHPTHPVKHSTGTGNSLSTDPLWGANKP